MCNLFVNDLYHGKEEFHCPSWRSLRNMISWNVCACMYVDAIFYLYM